MILGDFTEKDFELLAEALEAWKREPIEKKMNGSLITAMLGGGSNEERERRMKSEMDKAENESAGRKRIAILLAAKLELARQECQAKGIANADATPGGGHAS